MDRKFNFGKYKGKDIKYIILTHVGYIMWCLENINHFYLSDEEQEVYDAVAIAVKKYKAITSFPQDKLFAHIRNTDNFKDLKTPFIIRDGNLLAVRKKYMSFPVCTYVTKYFLNKIEHENTSEMLHVLAHEMVKDSMLREENHYADEDIYGGWNDGLHW